MRKCEYAAYVILGFSLLAGISACSDSGGNKNETAVSFPTLTESSISSRDVAELNFDASATWKLSSDKVWLKFIDGAGTYPSLSGKEGSQKVKVVATDGAMGFSSDTARVSMTMAGETQVIAVYYRKGKARDVRMYTRHDTELIEIESFTDSSFNMPEAIGFAANFDWMVDDSSVPEWLVSQDTQLADLCGEAGQKASDNIQAYVYADVSYRYQDLSGELKISSVDGKYTVGFPVKATSIPARQIYWIGKSITLRGGYLWDDKGGQLIKNPAEGTYSSAESDVVCHAVVLNNDFSLHFVQYDESSETAHEIPEADSWVRVVNVDGGKITLKPDVNQFRSERSLYLFLIPKDTTIDYDSAFSYGNFNFRREGYGIQLTQLGKSGGFEVLKQIDFMTNETLSEPVVPANAAEIAQRLGLQKPDNIYERVFSRDEWDSDNVIHVQPLGLIENWGDYDLYNSRFEKVAVPTGWATQAFEIDGVYDSQWNRHPTVLLYNRVPYDDIADSCLYIVIRGDSGKDLGTFVIKK